MASFFMKLMIQDSTRSGSELMKTYIFDCSEALRNQAEDLQNFTWPTLAALYHFHNAVSQSVAQGTAVSTLKKELFDSVGVQQKRTGFNTSFIKFSREELARRLATHHLFDLIGLYEAWTEAIAERFATHGIQMPGVKEGLQQPTAINTASGVGAVLMAFRQGRSQYMETVIYPVAQRHSKYSLAQLDNLLITYRAFKELRNAIIHLGGIADQRRENASRRFESLTAGDLRLARKPDLPPMRSGLPVLMTIAGVGGLTEVILRIVTTVDVELAVTVSGEEELWQRWARSYGDRPILWIPDSARMAGRMRNYAQHAHIPVPDDPLALIPWVQARGIRVLK
jgi:hypothetical protein